MSNPGFPGRSHESAATLFGSLRRRELIAAFGKSQPPIGAPGDAAKSRDFTQMRRGTSQLLTGARNEDLLYISNASTVTLYVMALFRHLRLAAAIVCFAMCFLTLPTQAAMADTKTTRVSACSVETNTKRIAFRVENPPAGTGPIALRVRLYDAKKDWLADQMIYAVGFDEPIPTIAGLLDPERVASAKCEIVGHLSSMDMLNFVEDGSLGMGQKTCPEHGGLIVDGGPDAEPSGLVYGKDWIYTEIEVCVNHFFPGQETDLNGDVLQVRLDRGEMQKVLVSGRDPQYIGILFTHVSSGFHEIDYGPWATVASVATNNDYHNLCLRTEAPARPGAMPHD